MTTNHCLNVLRTRRRRPEEPLEDVSHVADSVLDIVEVRELVDRLLDGQDERTRECVVYHYVDGMTHDEVGGLLGITGAAVRKRIATFRRDIAHRAPAWLGREEE